ncbi:MAG TPA: RbsD/FucU domain-containing protein [Acetobacteraceae bacterium]|nr:RbsD/FucU domain-containing protein [Acetobacteraceae bacterium]
MLKGLHPLISPPLLNVLAEMGHGDELAIVDANFPAATNAQRLVHAAGLEAPSVLEAVLTLLPLDDFVQHPAAIMTSGEPDRPPIAAIFDFLLQAAEGRAVPIEELDRSAFYGRAAGAFAVVATGERRLYGNILLRKGVIRS